MLEEKQQALTDARRDLATKIERVAETDRAVQQRKDDRDVTTQQQAEKAAELEAAQAEDQELAAASSIPEAVLEVVAKIDRRSCSEIQRLSNPPESVRTALGSLWLILQQLHPKEERAAFGPGAAGGKKKKGKEATEPDWELVKSMLQGNFTQKLRDIQPGQCGSAPSVATC